MIFVALGSNLISAEFKTSEQLLEKSVNSLEKNNIKVVRRSSWYRSAPIPASDQPWFVNGVVQVETTLDPAALLSVLHEVEAEYGRIRSKRNESRTLDLDLLAYDDQVIEQPGGLVLPHPRLQERAFVLRPLAEIAPAWRHPVTQRSAAAMLEALPPGQQVELLQGQSLRDG